MLSNLRALAVAGIMALGGLGISGTAEAGHYGDCQYKYVVCYETRCVPCTTYVTCYDRCGRPYQVEKVVYKHVQVAVRKRVAVCY